MSRVLTGDERTLLKPKEQEEQRCGGVGGVDRPENVWNEQMGDEVRKKGWA